MTTTQPEGFLATPSGSNGPGVLVLHAWWGLNQTMKDFCTRLSEAGFAVFAPDLYHGKVASTIPEAEAVVKALNQDSSRAESDIAAATKYLDERAGQPKEGLGVIGFSLGAYFALQLSATEPDHIRRVVVFYGTGGGFDFGAARASYLGHFAENDPFEPRAGVNEMEAEIKKAGRPVTFHHYPGTGHWFFEADRTDAYNKPAAELAWNRTLEFLKSP